GAGAIGANRTLSPPKRRVDSTWPFSGSTVVNTTSRCSPCEMLTVVVAIITRPSIAATESANDSSSLQYSAVIGNVASHPSPVAVFPGSTGRSSGRHAPAEQLLLSSHVTPSQLAQR